MPAEAPVGAIARLPFFLGSSGSALSLSLPDDDDDEEEDDEAAVTEAAVAAWTEERLAVRWKRAALASFAAASRRGGVMEGCGAAAVSSASPSDSAQEC